MTARPLRALGRTGVRVAPVGIGTNKWSLGVNDEPVLETWRAFLDGGGSLVDTAEVYGFGKSERLIGACLAEDPRPVTLVSKFAPFVARNRPRDLLAALDRTLARLGVAAVDLYLIHFPFPFTDLDALADALAQAVKDGKARHVGVSNFNAGQMRRAAERLAKAGIPLAANEVHYSLLHRAPETNGVLDACRELDCALLAYFPLASGRLARAGADEARLAALMQTLRQVAGAHEASPGQVALSWLLMRDEHIIPIPGATKARNVRSNLAALDFSLTEAEFAAIERASSAAR